MAGRALTKRYHEALDQREEQIFTRYIELRSIRKLAKELDISHVMLHGWLTHESRREMWAEAKQIAARDNAELAIEAIEAATPGNANAQRLKFDGHKWMAERQDPHEFGAKQQITGVVGTPGEWLDAMLASSGGTPTSDEQRAHENANGIEPDFKDRATKSMPEPPPSSKKAGA